MELSVPHVFSLQNLPTDLKVYLLTFLVVDKGSTCAAKLHNAAETIRNVMILSKSFSSLIYDVKVNGILIQHLSRYTNGNLTQAGLALATVGARKYVKSLFCGHNRWCFPIDQEINWAAAQETMFH